ncbi:MAG TPA: YebC/PmpR family DNA-binding transcriptional regulator [Symbiobacteriaceae bacterium]|nr:YebC/PmpR family DNA-binding transcriptional regulator [Symbiobacteriaceae bacterium]
MGRKWENIKRSKGKLDQERGAVFSRIAKDLMKAAKEGGPDPEANFRLKTAIETARESNMPSDNIQRAIRRGAGLEEGTRYEEFVYEGYGPGGVAIMMNIMTDNRNRTAGDVRFIFTKNGGAMGETGCVGWMFTKKGIIEIDREQTDVTEDDLMMVVLDAGADDIKTEETHFEVTTAPESLEAVLRALHAAKIPVVRGETAMIPNTTVEVTEENAEKLGRMLDLLEANDDVQNVYSNAQFPDEE